MNEESRIPSLDARAVVKRALDSWAYILLAFVFLLSILIGYSQVEFSPAIAVRVGVEYILLLVFCAVGRYCLDNIALKNGASIPAYTDALKRSEAVRERVKGIKSKLLVDFCEDFKREELESVRKQILSEALLDSEDFEEFCRTKKIPRGITRRQKLALIRAKNARPLRLNRYTLGQPVTADGERMTFTTPKQALKRRTVPDFLTTVFAVLFPVSITFSLILDPTLATLIAALLKTFTVAVSSAKGYSTRMRNMTEAVPAFVDQQEELLAAFDAWRAERGATETPKPALSDEEFAALQARYTPSVDVI